METNKKGNIDKELDKNAISEGAIPDVAEEAFYESIPDESEADIEIGESQSQPIIGECLNDERSESKRKRESRVRKTMLNAKVNLTFYFLMLCVTFFSRKIFLNCLGPEFIGLTGTLQNLLGYLNLAELGVGAAIAFNLYKPIEEGNKEKINELVSLFGYYYRIIGGIILIAGIILSAFFPLIFAKSDFSYGIIYFAYYSFLVSSLIGYFMNYRSTLLSADQRNYVVSVYFQSAAIVKTIIQLILAYYYANYYAWVAIELTFGVIGSLFLNYKIDKTYPWLKSSITVGKQQRKKYPNILKSTKQIFIHKIKDFILTQSDQLFIFAFVSLKMVAYYGNYMLIIGKLTSMFNTVLGSVTASVGNLVAENNKDKMLRVFWELSAFRYFVAGFICFNIYILITPFITLWLGEEYLLSQTVLILLMINLFISISRGTVDNYNFAYGHYGDVWSAWVEGLINIGVTIVCGYYWGITGILLGKTVSLIPIIVFWKPLYLFRDGLKESYWVYWKQTIKYYIIFGVSALLTYLVVMRLPFNPSISYGWWIVYSLICAGLFGIMYGILIIKWGAGGKNIVSRLPINFKTKRK